MRLIIAIFIFFISALSVFCQSLKTDDGIKHMEADFSAGLNTDGYQFDVGIAYFPLSHLGVKAQLGLAGEIEAMEDWGSDEWETGHYYTTRFKFTSSLVLRSPRIINWKQQDCGFYLFAEPGIILSPGARGSKMAKIMNLDLKAGVNLQFDRVVVTVGYGITNFTLYSGFPASYWGTPDTDNYITHSGFLGIGYKF